MYKFKVGDKVRVKSRAWYNKNKDANGYIYKGPAFIPAMVQFCDTVHIISEIGINFGWNRIWLKDVHPYIFCNEFLEPAGYILKKDLKNDRRT